MDVNNSCKLKNCRLRACLKEMPENERDYSESYPFNVYGYECHVPCYARVKVDKENNNG